MRARLTVAAVLFFSATTSPLAAENWPGWRGPRGDGTSFETGLPVRWSARENVAWKTALPGRGHASPIVWDDRVFTVSCVEETGRRVLVCLDRDDGRILWQQTVVESPLEGKHELNSFASSTPATDGELVYTAFLDRAEMVVAAHDFSGRRRWLVRPGPFASKHGFCTCPVLFEDLVIVNGDHDGAGFLAALHRRTGRTVWKIDRPNNTRSYCTPLVRELAGRRQLVMSGSKCVTSYDPRTGALLWTIDGPTEQFVASLVENRGLLFLTAGYPDYHILAIRPDGRGNVTDTHIAWRTTKGCAYVPSPIACGAYFLVVSDGGIASCFEAESGRRAWTERIGTHFSASPITAGGLVYFLADDGATSVVRPGPKFELVARNELGENCYASPAASAGEILVRTEEHLVCIRADGDRDGN